MFILRWTIRFIFTEMQRFNFTYNQGVWDVQMYICTWSRWEINDQNSIHANYLNVHIAHAHASISTLLTNKIKNIHCRERMKCGQFIAHLSDNCTSKIGPVASYISYFHFTIQLQSFWWTVPNILRQKSPSTHRGLWFKIAEQTMRLLIYTSRWARPAFTLC